MADNDTWNMLFERFPYTEQVKQRLRPHQQTVLDKIKNAVDAGHRLINVVLPTGAGKSYVIGMAPFVLQKGPVANVCYWQAINKSNAEFYKTKNGVNKFANIMDRGLPSLFKGMIGRINTASMTNTMEDAGIDFFGAIKFNKHIRTHMGQYKMFQIDEPQDMYSNIIDHIINNLPADAILITYSAFPKQDLLDHPGFFNIEAKFADCRAYVKCPKIHTISTANDICYEDLGLESHEDMMQRANRVNYDNPDTTSVPSTIMTKLYRTEEMFLKTLRKALEIRESMASPTGRKPGIIFKVGRQDMCLHWKRILEETVPEIRAQCILSNQDQRVNDRYLAHYENNNIDVLFIVQMLAVGWHSSRTAIICPLGGSTFSSLLQLYGRGNSFDPDFSDNILVMSDVSKMVTNFPQRFKDYANKGLVQEATADILDDQVERQTDGLVPRATDRPAPQINNLVNVSFEEELLPQLGETPAPTQNDPLFDQFMTFDD